MAVVLFGDGSDIDKLVPGADFVVVLFSRENVEGGLTGDALDRLMSLSDSPAFVDQLADRLTFMFEGYDDDPRELTQIPECVSFFRAVTKQWPYWFHFLEKTDSSISMAIHLLCDMRVVLSRNGMTGSHFVTPAQFPAVAMRLFDGMNALYDAHGISEEDNEAMSAKVNAALNRIGA